MRVLVTGSAGFIGSALTLRLLERGDRVIGLDNHNNYYDPAIKEARLARFGGHSNYNHLRVDLADRQAIEKCFSKYRPECVVNLAAQAGVRYSIDNPLEYINSNIVGFAHILEGCRHHGVEHLVYASSSSVYGANTTMPFSVHHNVDHPLSLYAASKKANELMAHAYFSQYKTPSLGLRFFTVYGPWGRLDMAPIMFAEKIRKQQTVHLFAEGKLKRDFTYIGDTVFAISRLIELQIAKGRRDIVNIGHSNPIQVLDFLSTLAGSLNMAPKIEFAPMQISDVPLTCANDQKLQEWIGPWPETPIATGLNDMVQRLTKWEVT